MNPKRGWVEYNRRSITTKAPYRVVEVPFEHGSMFKIKDRNGITAYTRKRRASAEAFCERLNLKAAEAVLSEQ